MLLLSDILKTIEVQQNTFTSKKIKVRRELIDSIPDEYFRLLIITGIRNSGKSTLLFQLYKEKFGDALYINFEHPRFYNFDSNDLFKLDEIIEAKKSRILFFDEIQSFNDWNNYVRQKIDEGFQVVIASSDTSVLHSDIDAGFTGLNISKELFPFSFNEYCSNYAIEKNSETVVEYMQNGGFPGFIEAQSDEFLVQLFDNLLIREIAVRNKIRDLRALKRMAIHLLSNIGSLITGNQLKQLLGIKTTSTVIDYLSAFEVGYLFFFVPRFSYSVRKQSINPRKVYAIDTGLVLTNSGALTNSTDCLLENMVFLHLRKKVSELYYYSEKFDCDFVVMNRNRVEQVIQVCEELKQDNLATELNGLYEAMDFFEMTEGTLVTMNQTDRFERNGKVITVVPFYEFA